MIPTICSLILIFQQDSTQHTHVAPSGNLPIVQQMSGSVQQFTDSTVFFQSFRDINDVKRWILSGTQRRSYAVNGESHDIALGMHPWDASITLHEKEITDPIKGQLHPSFWMMSGMNRFSPSTTAIGQSPITWVMENSPKPFGSPVTTFYYQQGYEKLQAFEGVFSAQIATDWKMKIGVGRKTFLGDFVNSSSDLYQFSAYLRHQPSLKHQINYMFSTAKLSNGNSGGVNDSLNAQSNLSAVDPRQAQMMYPKSTTRDTRSLFHMQWVFSDTLAQQPIRNSVLFHFASYYSATSRPAQLPFLRFDDYQRHEFSEWSFSNQLRVNTGRLVWVGYADAGVQQLQFKGYSITEETGFRWLMGGGFELPISILLLTADAQTSHSAVTGTSYKLSGGLKVSGDYWTSEASIFLGQKPTPRLRSLLVGSAVTSADAFTGGFVKSSFSNDNFLISSGASIYRNQSDGAIYSVGRLVSDSLHVYQSALGSYQSVSSWLELKNFGSWYETGATYVFTKASPWQPDHELKLQFGYRGHFFRENLLLMVGLEGYYRSESPSVFHDARHQLAMIEVGEKLPAYFSTDVYIRAKVSDMMFRITWENVGQESFQTMTGQPVPISRVHIGIMWWIWN